MLVCVCLRIFVYLCVLNTQQLQAARTSNSCVQHTADRGECVTWRESIIENNGYRQQ